MGFLLDSLLIAIDRLFPRDLMIKSSSNLSSQLLILFSCFQLTFSMESYRNLRSHLCKADLFHMAWELPPPTLDQHHQAAPSHPILLSVPPYQLPPAQGFHLLASLSGTCFLPLNLVPTVQSLRPPNHLLHC